MRRTCLAVALLLAACTPQPAGDVFPWVYRGAWAETSEACARPEVRIGARRIDAYGSRCRLDRWAASSAGGVLARLECVRPDGTREDELARLRRRGDWLELRLGDARLSWRSCR